MSAFFKDLLTVVFIIISIKLVSSTAEILFYFFIRFVCDCGRGMEER